MPTLRRILFVSLAMFLAACAAPQGLPAGLTPIPTLIPVTEPPSAANTPVYAVLSYPARLPSATSGQPLYQARCAKCHGADGKGVVPGARNFNDLDYMRGETPAYFYATVTEGRNEMPAFSDQITSDERWDAVAYVWRFSTTSDALAQGQALFDADCAACHGNDGTGKVLGAADFTDLRLMDSLAPRDLYLVVTQGKGSMPAWQERLTQTERWAVIDYVRAFSYDAILPGEHTAEPVPSTTPAQASCDAYLSQTNPFAWDDAGAIDAGKSIYTQDCVMCHGADGSGALPGAPDFTKSDFQNALHTSSGQVLCYVANGRAAMPGWKETLTADEMWQVLTYIGTLGKP
jgi:mono/diheme cytochrome c family protein